MIELDKTEKILEVWFKHKHAITREDFEMVKDLAGLKEEADKQEQIDKDIMTPLPEQLQSRTEKARISIEPHEVKVCNKCRRRLPIDVFSIMNKKTGERRGTCRECYLKYQRNYAKTHPKRKMCTKCGKKKYVGEFQKNIKSPDGRQSWCTECKNEYQEKKAKEELVKRHTVKTEANKPRGNGISEGDIPVIDSGRVQEKEADDKFAWLKKIRRD